MLDEDADLNWYDYGFRNYDPQIGRFMQLDPLTDSYPFLTPYQYASNDPITNIDIDGLEGGDVVKAGFNLPEVGAALMDNATEFGKTFHITFSGFKTATGNTSKVVHHVVNRTANAFPDECPPLSLTLISFLRGTRRTELNFIFRYDEFPSKSIRV